MNEQRLQEKWACFAQTEPGNVLERQHHLDDFLEHLLLVGLGGSPISTLIHFSDVGSVVSLLGGQFLADVEHICLGSVSYDSDVSSSATSRSVGSSVSEVSRASEGSRGCRPRVVARPVVKGGRTTVDTVQLPRTPGRSRGCDSGQSSENQDQVVDIQGQVAEYQRQEKCDDRLVLSCQHQDQHTPEMVVRGHDSRSNLTSITQDITPTEETRVNAVDGRATKSTGPQSSPQTRSCQQEKETSGVLENGVECANESHASDSFNEQSQDTSNQTPTPRTIKTINQTDKDSVHTNQMNRSNALQGSRPPQGSSGRQGMKPAPQDGDCEQGKESQNAAMLRKYLLHGCGAKILITLDRLGVAGLTGSREISHVLSFIFTFMLKNTTLEDIEQHNDDEGKVGGLSSEALERYCPYVNLSLDEIFTTTHPTLMRRSGCYSATQLWLQTSGSKSSSLSSSHSTRKVGRRRRKRHSACLSLAQSDSEAEEHPRTARLARALVKFTINPNDFDYYTRAVYSDEERCPDLGAGHNIHDHTRLSAQSFIHQHKFCLSLAQLLQFIISIQVQLAVHEAEVRPLSAPLLATHDILQFSLETLTWLVGEVPSGHHKGQHSKEAMVDVHELLPGILRLVFSSIQRFLKSTELLHTITELCVVPKVLDLAIKLLSMNVEGEMVQNNDSNKCEESETSVRNFLGTKEALLARDMVAGLLYLLLSCTCIRVEVKDVWQCLHLHKVFLQNGGPEIVQKIVFLKEVLPLSQRQEVMTLVSKLVLHLKYWRQDVDHAEKCEKKTHRFCDYQSAQSHHSQMLGTSSNIISEGEPSTCMVANFSCLILECVANSEEEDLCCSCVHMLGRCGLCCCMSSRMVLSKLLDGALSRMTTGTNTITLFVERVMWQDLGGLALAEPVRCPFCQIPDVSTDYTLDESFTAAYCAKSQGSFQQLKNYNMETPEHSLPLSLSHWEGVVLYRKFLFQDHINSKIINHITRLVSQSNTRVKLELCEHLIIPSLRQACDRGIEEHLEGSSRFVLVGLIKCFRLTLEESADERLLEFLEDRGAQLISECRDLPGLRYESFALLCSAAKKELHLQPSSNLTEEDNRVFTKLLVLEMIQRDELWSAYFRMKAEEVRQRFFIHTRVSTDDSKVSAPVVENVEVTDDAREVDEMSQELCETGEDVIDSCCPSRDISFVSTGSDVLVSLSALGSGPGDKEDAVLDGSEVQERKSEIGSEMLAVENNRTEPLTGTISECEVEEVQSNDGSRDALSKTHGKRRYLRRSEKIDDDTMAPSYDSSDIPEEGEGEARRSFSSSSPRRTHSLHWHKLSHQLSRDVKNLSMEELGQGYGGLGELWGAVREGVEGSHELRVFLAESAVRSVAAPLLLSISQDLARASSGSYEFSSVVLEQLPVTFSLIQSLLTFIIVTFPHAGLPVSTVVSEMRGPLLRYSPSTCGHVKHLVSVMLHCCVLPSLPALSHYPNPSQTEIEQIEEETGAEQHEQQHQQQQQQPQEQQLQQQQQQQQQAGETDGYEADTEQPQITPSSLTARSVPEEDDLQCPELVLLALDLIINHHERYLETHEEARQEAEEARKGGKEGSKSVDQTERRTGPSQPGDHSWDQQQQQLKDQSLERERRGAEAVDDRSTEANQMRNQRKVQDQTRDQRSEGDVLDFRDVKLSDTATKALKEKSNRTIPNMRVPLKEPGGGGGKKRRRRKRPSAGPSDAESASSTSSVYHTLPSDGSNTTDGQDSDWEPDVSFEREEEKKTSEGFGGHEEEEDENIEESQTARGRADVEKKDEEDETGRYSGGEDEEEKLVTDVRGECPEESAAEEETRAGVCPVGDYSKGSIRKDSSSGVSLDKSSLAVTTTAIKDRVCDGVEAFEGESAGERNTNDYREIDSALSEEKHMQENLEKETGETLCGSKEAAEPVTCRKSDATSPSPDPPSSVSHCDPQCCGSEAGHSATLTQCVHALLLLCRSSPAVCRRLHTLGLLSRLLEGFTDLIAANSLQYQDVVGTVVGVWAEVAQWRLAPSDLSQFLALFKADAPPVETLLGALNRVLEVSSREPQSALSFPCPATSPSSLHHHHLTDTLTPHAPVHAPPPTPAAEAITRLHNAHIRHGLESCIAVSCVVCPVPRSLDWSPYNSGLACTTWVCIQDNGRSGTRSRYQMSPQSSFGQSSQSDAFFEGAARGSYCGGASSLGRDVGPTRLHLLSVGTQHLMFSLWITTDKDYFEVCVSREVERESVVVSRGCGGRMGLCDGAWHHLALSIPTINVRRGGNLKISLVVDAVTFHAVTVAVPAVGSIKKSSPAYLLLGHTHSTLEGEEGVEWAGVGPRVCTQQPPGLLMGNTFLFREPCLSRELCLYLGALGPDTTSLMPLTARDERVLLSRLITPKLLSAGLDLSVLYGPAGVLVRPAQECLLLLHIAQHPQHYLCYKPHIPSLQDTGNHYPSSSWQTGVLLGAVTPLRSQGPDLALLRLGGIMHIIYLFARLVEVGCGEEVQSAGVRLLMGCIQASPQLAAQYEGLRGSSLLFRVLSSPLAMPGIQVMKALVDACTSASVIQYQASRDVYTLAPHVPAALTHRHHLLAVITAWKTFHPDPSANLTTKYCVDEHGERLTVLGMLLSVVRVLLSDTQPYRDFNLAQLRDIDALDKILFMCKELELTTGGVEGVCAAQLLVAVVTGLVGAPSATPANTLSSGLSLMLSAQDSLSSGFCSVPSSAPMPMLPFGLPWCGLGPGMVRVRDIAAVWGFLLLAHPAHLTYAATSQSTAYYLPRVPTPAAPHRSGQLVSVGVDLAAEMMDQPDQQQTLQHFQTGEWQIIENRDPFVQLQQIRQQQKAEIRKLRREGSIARGAYDSSDEDDDSEEWNVKSEDQVDRQFLQHKDSIALSHSVTITKTQELKAEDGSSTDVAPRQYHHQEQRPGPARKRKISEGRSKAIVKTLPKAEKWVTKGIAGEDDEDDDDDDEDEEEDGEEGDDVGEVSCLVQLVVGLLGVVDGVLRAASDTTARTVLAEALTTEQTVVMANHPHPLVRSAVLKLFGVVLERCSPEDGVVLLRQNVPLILAQQLHKHTLLSSHLVTAAFSLALGRTFTFDDYAVDCDPTLSLPHKVVLFVPLLAVLPHTPQDVALSHNSLMVLLDLLHKNMELIVPLIQKAHIVDALVCTLRAALHTEGVGVSDVTGESESGVLVADVTEILSWVINCLVASPQHKNFMLSLEVLHQVNLVRRGEAAVCGGQACCVGHLQSTEAALLQVALSRTQATASTHQHTLPQETHSTFKLKKTSMSGSTSLHNLKLFSPLAGREDSDSGLGSVLANYTTIPFTKSLHNISDQLFHGGFSSSSSSSQQMSDTERREDKVLAHSELLYRFKVLVQKATDFLFMSAWSSVESVASAVTSPAAAETFSLFLLELLLSAVAAITQRKGNNGERCGWERMVWACQDILRMHLSHLLVLATSPRTHLATRTRAVHTLTSHPRSQAIVSYVVKSNHQLLYKVGIFVHELRYQNKGKLESGDVRSCEGLLQLLEEAGVHVLPPPEMYPPQGAMREWSLVGEEKRLWQEESAKIAVLVVERCTKQDKRLLSKNVSMYEAVAQECSRLTRLVVDRQHVERKAVLSGIKRSQCRRVRLTHRWRELALVLTHERATWHSQNSYPRSWELDQTEGPMRVRRRLTRGRLNINPRYLMPGYTHKIEVERCSGPLESVLEEDSEMESAMSVMIERLNASERIVHMSRACVVSPGREQRGEVLVSLTAMYFVGEQLTVDMNQSGSTNEVVSVTWPFDTVREVHLRRYQLQDCALELFLTGGHSVLLAFSDTHHCNQVVGVLGMSEMPNISSKASLPEVTQQWREGHMTNFEYLTQLNKLAGRSFNDLMQYPVFPFILSNYTSDILSLHDPTNFRNLKKPIAVQHPHKEQHYINNYEITAQLSQDASDGPYHYGSHYSNSGIVLHFLVRLPPFTQLFLRYQDGNFDIPDRTFHSLQTTWRLASCDSTTDFKELTPEFFFLPEIFLNSEGFNMGVRQSGERVHHVQLPPWSCDDPRRFVLVHRAALESPLVTQNLHHWIDLVFGYKQNGRAAVEAINVFHPATYFGYDVESGVDEISREARKAMIKTYGQTPQQLFTSPHPPVIAPPRPQSPQAPEVLHEVRGLHWGTYAGSPADDRPTLALIQNLKTPATTVTSLSLTELLLIGPHAHLLTLRPDKGASSAYVVSSDHRDNIIRCRRLKDSLPQPLISVPPYDEVRWCSCGIGQVWVGLASGQILVYSISASTVGDDLVTTLPPSPLLAHTAPVTHMHISHAFSICVSGGEDGLCVIWDTNRLRYVRSVGCGGVGVQLVGVSETLGDWASVTPLGERASVLRLYTVNAALVDSVVTPAPVTAIAFTAAPEGTAVNVIATSLADGVIRLWSIWDLRPVRELRTDRAKQPITSLHYTPDNNHLCGITETGVLVVWETSLVKTKLPKFITVPRV